MTSASDYRLAVAIRTADRSPGPNYLRGTLESLRASGAFSSPQLGALALSDGGPGGFAAEQARDLPWWVTVSSGPETPNGNAARALRLAAEAGCPWVLFMEDDVEVCHRFADGVAAWLSRHDRGGHRLFTFGSSHKALPLAAARGHEAAVVPAQDFFGTTCYALRQEDAARLATWLRRYPTYNGTTRSHDLLLRRWLSETYPKAREVLASVPCMVQHVGDASLLSPGRGLLHRYDTWPGPEWAYPKGGLWAATSPS